MAGPVLVRGTARGVLNRLITGIEEGRSNSAAVFTLTIVYWTTTGALKLAIPLYLSSLGAQIWVVGLAVSSSALVPLFLAIPVGRLADVIGCKRTITIGSLGMIVAGLLFRMPLGLIGVFIAQPILGLSEVFVWAPCQALMTKAPSQHARARQVSFNAAAISVGQLIGPLVGGSLADSYGYSAVFFFFIAGALFSFTASMFLITDVKAPRWSDFTIRGSAATSKVVLGSSGVTTALFYTFLMLCSHSITMSFLPLLLKGFGYSPGTIGFVMSVKAAAALVVRSLFMPLVNRFGALPTLNMATAISIISVALTPAYGHHLGWMTFGAAITGFGWGLNMPLTILVIGNGCPEQLIGLAMGFRLTVNRFAQLINPLVFGFVSHQLTLPMAFYFSGVTLVTVLTGFSFKARRKPVTSVKMV